MDLQNFPQPTRPLSFSKLTSFKYSAAITQLSEPIILQDSESKTNYRQPQESSSGDGTPHHQKQTVGAGNRQSHPE